MARLITGIAHSVLQSLKSLVGQRDAPLPAAEAEGASQLSPFTATVNLMKAPIRPDILDYIAQKPAEFVDAVRGCLPLLVREMRSENKEASADRLLHFYDYLLQLQHEGHQSMVRTVEENWRARSNDAMQMMLYCETEEELVATVVAYHDTLRDTNAALLVAQDMRATGGMATSVMMQRLERMEKIARNCEHHDPEEAVKAAPPVENEPAEAREFYALMRRNVLKKALFRLLEAPDAKSYLECLRLRRDVLLGDFTERRLDQLWQILLDENGDGEAAAFFEMHRDVLYECRENGIESTIGCAANITYDGSVASPDAVTS